MNIRTIEWKNNAVRIIDQTRLPAEFVYLAIKDLKSLWLAIKKLKVRGAPALGAAAAWGVYLGVKNIRARNFSHFKRRLDKVISYLSSARPTAINLFWALERMRAVAECYSKESIQEIKKALFKEAQTIAEEDRAACRRIGCFGSRLINDGENILTICNAGILATIDYGTALAVIYRAKEEGKRLKVYACETRPLLQGARLTTWELKRKGIDVTLITDGMAAALMYAGKVDKVIVGADRIAANGDTANKIGTYNLAILSRYHKIPFYVAAPVSTFDLRIKRGKEIRIEQRPAEEVTRLFFKKPIANGNIKVFNPAFDITPAALISNFITDRGIINKPYSRNILKTLRG
ncbi:MAG: S-methyl-5-thioribose-1-phosphate isomerase [Candidatus Omnitrophica bacterium]|nr:S-methyl-5-thioribose-1-phosphate isomerase [Candidatus Omnitrophota bacterium]